MSPSVLEIFATDARKYVDRLQEAIAGDDPNVDAVRRSSRRLQHAAVLADHAPVIHAAQVLQKSSVQVIAGKRDWSDDLIEAIRATMAELDAVVSALPGSDAEAEARLKNASDALFGLGGAGEAPDDDDTVEPESSRRRGGTSRERSEGPRAAQADAPQDTAPARAGEDRSFVAAG
jgi:hypothetical protein